MPWSPHSLCVSKPSTTRTPEAARAADRTDSQTNKEEGSVGKQRLTSSPQGSQPLPPGPAPGCGAYEDARSPRLLPAGGLARRLLTALSAPTQREGARGRWSPGSPACRTPPLHWLLETLPGVEGVSQTERASAGLRD